MADAKPLVMFRSKAGRALYFAAYDAVLRNWPVPFEEVDVATRFGGTHVIVSGARDAPPLILLASALGGAAAWRANAAALGQHFRTYAIDVIGEPNKSLPTRRIWSRRSFALWLTDLMDALGIERASIVGNSYGGFLALNQAMFTPDRIARVVLISPAGTFTGLSLEFFYQFFFSGMLRSRKRIRRALAWMQNGVELAPLDQPCEDLVLHALMQGQPANPVGPKVFTSTELQQVRAPTLLLIGEKEKLYPPHATLQKAQRRMPGLKAEIIPGANHRAALSHPVYVNRRVLDFLGADGP